MAIRTIIAAIALAPGDGPVAARAMRLAEEHGARLVLVHAIESLPTADPALPAPADEAAVSEVLMAEAHTALEAMAATRGVEAAIEIHFGAAAALLERLARALGADLLVIGPGKPQNLREKLFGSTADRLVRASPCPVLVVKRATDRAYRRAIAATDFSPIAFAAAQAAVHVAPQAALELVHVLEIPLSFEQAMMKVGTPQTAVDRYRRARAGAAREALRALRADLPRLEDSRVRVVHGDAATALLRLARARTTDLVALGMQGRSAIAEAVLGSVARRVLAAAPCDVLLARGSDPASE